MTDSAGTGRRSIVVQCGIPPRPMKILFEPGLDGDVDVSVRIDPGRPSRKISKVTIGFYAMKGGGRGPAWVVQELAGSRRSKVAGTPEEVLKLFRESLETAGVNADGPSATEAKIRRAYQALVEDPSERDGSLGVLAFTLRATDPTEFGSCLRSAMGTACLTLLQRANELSLHFNSMEEIQKVFADALSEHVMRS